MNTDDFEEPETFECESPLHVSKREVHISEGGCDEIEIGLGMALCSECWCKYADLIEAAPVPNEASS